LRIARPKAWILFIALAFVLTHSATAQPLREADVPAPLRPWIPWVLHGADDRACPYAYDIAQPKRCLWPGLLSLDLSSHGGRFELQVETFRALQVPLPGDAAFWPQDLRVGNQPAAVLAIDGLPGVLLPPGTHKLTGRLAWDRMPENLRLPPDIGLIALRLNGRTVAAPRVDTQGRLWLQSETAAAQTGARLEVRIERLLSDDIPFQVTTRFALIASGPSQEVVLPGALLAEFTPLSLSSPLPARLENGKLRVQVRAGRWDVYVVGRRIEPVAALALPQAEPKATTQADVVLPSEEIWAFAAQNRLRVVNVDGGTPVDAQQTQLPQDWKRFPVYRVQPGEALRLTQIKRGDPQPAPDALRLNRIVWLDFDGRGYTLQDRISGTMSRSWRLEAAAPLVLGRAAIDGQDQLITRGAKEAGFEVPGFEVRQGRADIVADSRIETSARAFPAIGWASDFQAVAVQLNLPPGWRLFTATGADHVQGSWLGHWNNLLDFFIVLVMALGVGKLWGWRWALVALAALAISYYEAGAPQFLWIFALVAVALARVVTSGIAGVGVTWLRRVALLALLLPLLPFAVQQVRQTLYPVLEEPYITLGEQQRAEAGLLARTEAPAAAPPEAEEQAQMADKSAEDTSDRPSKLPQSVPPPKAERRAKLYSKSAELDRIDPKAQIQTGPGLPQWAWRSHQLSWSGSVQSTQELRLWLIAPPLNALLTVLRLVLLALLFLRVADVTLPRPRWPGRPPSPGRGAAALAGAALVACALALPPDARAEATPSPELLRELKEKLLQPPQCAPRCAELARMQIAIAGETLRIRIEVNAAAPVAIPLPGAARAWLPQDVLLDGQRAVPLARDGNGTLWIRIPQGVHQVLLQGDLQGQDAIQLAMPLKPHRVESQTPGWTLDGLRSNGVADTALQLTRQQRKAGSELKGETLPPLLRVERTLLLGLEWKVQTRVTRLSPAHAPALIEVPLLPGEAVINPDVRVERSRALVSMGPQSTEVAWESALKEAREIPLVAAQDLSFVEVWRLSAGTQWHVEIDGIAPVQHQESGRWLPQWQPWPGERVVFKVVKPEGVPGQTLTLDRSRLVARPGLRASDATLSLTLRSSRGGQHPLRLPADAVLQKVTINGEPQPIRLETGSTLRLPLAPGAQEVEVQWQQPDGIAWRYAAPEADAGIPSVNARTVLHVPRDRWLLGVGGPAIGPAILFWGVVIVVAVAAYALGRVTLSPLRWWQWLLLGLGLTQASVAVAAALVAWFFAFALRARYAEKLSERHWVFDVAQVGLVLLTLAAGVSLYSAVSHGLLGTPAMQVVGNGSSYAQLNWFQDRAGPVLPTPWMISVPILVYRLLMLAWALWLAYSLLTWARWAWQSFSTAGLWRRGQLWTPRAKSKPAVDGAAGETKTQT
jgi:hypothetical protein